MKLYKDQLIEGIKQALENGEGLNDLMRMTFDITMAYERKAFLADTGQPNNKGNGYRPGQLYGNQQQIKVRIPRDRLGHFTPQLMSILRNEQEEADRLAMSLYCKGLTQRQVGEVFEEIYGKYYSQSSISMMVKGLKEEVDLWQTRPLESWYPAIYIDALYVKVHRNAIVENEAFYVVMGVKEDLTRDVLDIQNIPVESALGWQDVLNGLKLRGVKEVELFIADGLTGLESSITKVYPTANFQKCVTHLKRGLLSRLRHSDKAEMGADLKNVFQMENPYDTKEAGYQRWIDLCKKWEKRYHYFKTVQTRSEYQYYFTYLEYHPMVRRMIYTTNWIERLQRDFRRVLKMRGAMPNEESVIVLMAKVAMDKKAYQYPVTSFRVDEKLSQKKQAPKGKPTAASLRGLPLLSKK